MSKKVLYQALSFVPVVAAAVPFVQSISHVPYQRVTLYQSIADPVPAPASETVTVDKWLNPLSQPLASCKLPTADQQFIAFVRNDSDALGWLSALSEPIRLTRRLEGSTSLVQAAPFAETVSADRWVQPFTQPLRRAQKPPESASAFVPVVAAPSPGTGNVLFAQTTTTTIHRRDTLYQSVADPVPIVSGETVTVDKWFRPFDPPVRRVTTPEGASAFVKADPFPETVSVDRWLQPLSSPLKKLTLAANQQQAVVFVAPATTPETITPDKWLSPLSEPKCLKGLPAGERQALAFVKSDPFPETVSVDRWLVQLSEPTRRKAKPPEAASAFVSVVTAPSPGSGDVLFSQVNQSLIVSKTTLYQSISEPVGFTATPPVVVSVDSWFVQLSTPPDAGFGSLDLSAAFAAVEPSFGWYEPLSEPVRRKVSAAWQPPAFQSNYLVPAPYVDPPMASWSYSWSLPVRLRTGLLAANQSGAVAPIIPIPNPPTPTGVYTVSGLYVTDQFTNNTVVYDYGGGVSHRTN